MIPLGPDAIYCDGGTIGKNPSPIGGTWAWCWVVNGKRVLHDSGIIKAEHGEKITNNVAELMAATAAIGSLPDGWMGTLYTDSLVTMYRVQGSKKFNGVPEWLVSECKRQRGRFIGKCKLLAGHPTAFDLSQGCNAAGVAVSEHNAWCDKECQRQADRAVES